MVEKEADFITIVSSEMIAEVMEAHFNKSMYKKKVVIVDLKSTEGGYMFSLAFDKSSVDDGRVKRKEEEYHTDVMQGTLDLMKNQVEQHYEERGQVVVRDKNGKFIRKQKV